MTKGPIVIVEDDPDDQDMYGDAIKKLGLPNRVIFFDAGKPALEYLSSTADQPFIILSDINMPAMNGIELKTYIHQDDHLRDKGIPFIFISTNASPGIVRQAHQLSVQGYFEKPASMEELVRMLGLLFSYWALCKHVNNTRR